MDKDYENFVRRMGSFEDELDFEDDESLEHSEDELTHYGVKGMRWGVRRKRADKAIGARARRKVNLQKAREKFNKRYEAEYNRSVKKGDSEEVTEEKLGKILDSYSAEKKAIKQQFKDERVKNKQEYKEGKKKLDADFDKKFNETVEKAKQKKMSDEDFDRELDRILDDYLVKRKALKNKYKANK